MSSPDLTFQEVAYAAVRAQAGAAARVETEPATDELMPYTFIGECQGGDHEIGKELFLTVHTWSKAIGTDEAKTMQHVVYTALHSLNFTKNEWVFTCCREEYSNVILDPDRESWHGVQRFRVLASQ